MGTLEEQFNERVQAFLSWSGMSPTTLGMKAVGDPNLLRQIARGRSLSLRTADRVLAFIAACELDSGGARAPSARPRRPRPATRPRETERSRAMTARPKKETSTRTRFLRVSEVAARTSLGRSTIYRWSAEGRFPAPIRLGGQVLRWVEAEVDGWTRKWLAEGVGGGRAAPPPTPRGKGKRR